MMFEPATCGDSARKILRSKQERAGSDASRIAQRMVDEPDIVSYSGEITIVHTGETSVRDWNPLTHEEVHEELPDGNVRTIVRPKGDPNVSIQ